MVLEDLDSRPATFVVTFHLSAFAEVAPLTAAGLRRKAEEVRERLAQLGAKDIEIVTGKPFLPRCQDMPPEAFLSPERAAALYEQRRRGVKVVSCCWRCPGMPDPDGRTLEKMLGYLNVKRGGHGEYYGLFVDFACIPQDFAWPSWHAPEAVARRFGAEVSQGPLTVLKFECERVAKVGRYARDEFRSVSARKLRAEKPIDGPIRERLADGTVRLLRCAWLLSADSDKYLGRDASGRVIMRRRQELPKEAFFTNEEAVALLDRDDRSILHLSYRWLTALHPDPHGMALLAVRRFLRSEAGLDKCGMFWDFASLPQKDIAKEARGLPPRTPEEADTMRRALKGMPYFFASVSGTAIVQLKDIPPRPSEYDGRMIVFDMAFSESTSEKDVKALQSDLERFGGKITKIAIKAGEAQVTFATHEQAIDCIAELDKVYRGAHTVYNETAYSRDRGEPFSGWCTFEEGCSKLVVAHLNTASRQASKRSEVLPERFARANASRAKLIDISDGMVRTVDVKESPVAVLKQTSDDLEFAAFVGKGEAETVKQLLAELEWSMHLAIEHEHEWSIHKAIGRSREERKAAAEGVEAQVRVSILVDKLVSLCEQEGWALASMEDFESLGLRSRSRDHGSVLFHERYISSAWSFDAGAYGYPEGYAEGYVRFRTAGDADAARRHPELKRLCGGKEPMLMGEHVFENELKFKRALSVLACLYASATGTCVLQLTDPPGEIGSYDVAPSELVSERTGTVVRTDTSLEELRKELGDGMLACEKMGLGEVVVRVDGERAARAVRSLNERGYPLRRKDRVVYPMYNLRPYGSRGRPVFETSAASLVVAYVTQRKHQGKPLPPLIAKAEKSSPKLINIDVVGAPRVVEVKQSPERLLRECIVKLRSRDISFPGKADRENLVQLLRDLDASIAGTFYYRTS